MAKVTLDIVLDSKGNVRSIQQAGTALGGLDKDAKKTTDSLDKLKKVAGLVGGAMAAIKAAQVAVEFVKLGAKVEATEHRFQQFAGGADQAAEYLQAFQDATYNTVDRMASMQGAAKLLQMGLVDNADEMARVAGIATQLGDQTMAAGDRIADFAALLANQSIPRLDNFGISSGRVRTRIDELLKSGQALDREQAFKMAVMEEGAKSMAILGDTSDLTSNQIAELEAAFSEAKVGAAEFAAEMLEVGGAGDWLSIRLRGFPETLRQVTYMAIAADVAMDKFKFSLMSFQNPLDALDDAWAAFQSRLLALTLPADHVSEILRYQHTVMGNVASQAQEAAEGFNQLADAETTFSASNGVVDGMVLREKSIRGVVDATLALNQTLMEADRQQIGQAMIGKLREAFMAPDSKVSEEAYRQAVNEIQLTFGLADAKSILLTDSMIDLTTAFVDGSLGAGAVDDQLNSLVGRLSEGEEMAIAGAEALVVFEDAMRDTNAEVWEGVGAVQNLNQGLAEIERDITIRVRYEMTNAPSDTPGYANGTMYAPGGMSRINEGGRGELVSLPRGSRVHTAQQSARIMNNTFNITNHNGYRGMRNDVYALRARNGR